MLVMKTRLKERKSVVGKYIIAVDEVLKQIGMELASKVGDAVSKALNSNKVLNVVLMSAFGLLCLRSVQQQKNMEVLEAEKDSLLNSNKAMKKTMWDWKQQLFAEADLPNPLIPLSKLKAIYGEVQTTTSTSGADAQNRDGKSPAPVFIV